jgi:hypothetical protein
MMLSKYPVVFHLQSPCAVASRTDFETVFPDQDELLLVLPQYHPFVNCSQIPLQALCNEPFMLFKKGTKSEISGILERSGLTLNIRFTT